MMEKELKEKIIKEYLLGKGSTIISRELKVYKPGVLKVIRDAGLTRKRDRCKSLDIQNDGDNFYILRKCPICKKDIKSVSKNKTIACRNHFRKTNEKTLCKPCSLKLQKGKENPFYGKKHTKETLISISKTISENPPRQNSVSSKEKKLLTKIKNLKYKPVGSYQVDKYVCDIFIKELNLIIEFNGDYWHCNPKKYDKDYLHPHKNKTAKEIWEEDKLRIDNIKSYGYNLIVIWESDFEKPSFVKNIITEYVKN
jgi:G:T-mismatch repair DNA endonuclease (very short patch repair protein)